MQLLRLERLPAITRDHPQGGPVLAAVILLFAITIVAALYLGRVVFVPLAIALLLAFVLTPVITGLRRYCMVPRSVAVLLTVSLLFAGVVATGAMMARQFNELIEELPGYQWTLREKVKQLRGLAGGSRAVKEASKTLESLGKELEKPADGVAGPRVSQPGSTEPSSDEGPRQTPVPVVVRQEPGVLETIQRVAGVVIEPLATTGIVFVFLAFILFQREDVRDRAIRLFGSSDLERTTAAMDDAAGRLSRFLLTQTILNACYGTVIGLALWAIGVPTPILWGILAFLMRFVPFIGSFIAAGFPVVLAAAVDPTWTSFWLTLSVYLVGEPLMGQVVEPLVQGKTTGLSPLAIVVSASFWTLLWGPIGLMLAVPLTACLVILGRHIKTLEFLHVILGDTPPLDVDQKFYQRALAGRADEATEDAETLLRDMSIVTYCDEVAMPGLRLAYIDAEQGILSDKRQALVCSTVAEVFDNLTEFGDEPLHFGASDVSEATKDDGGKAVPGPRGPRRALQPVAMVAARTDLDQSAADVFGRLLLGLGLDATSMRRPPGQATGHDVEAFDGVKLVIISALGAPEASGAQLRYLVRRVRKACPPDVEIVVAFWDAKISDEVADETRRKLAVDTIVTTCAGALRYVTTEVRAGVAPKGESEENEPKPTVAAT